MESVNSRSENLEILQQILDESRGKFLELEVLLSAFEEIKKNPVLSIHQALEMGFSEWMK